MFLIKDIENKNESKRVYEQTEEHVENLDFVMMMNYNNDVLVQKSCYEF